MHAEIHICKSSEDFKIAKKITEDYFEWLGMDLYFQNLESEWSNFEQMYGDPEGCFIYVSTNNKVVGGVGVRKLEGDICEMKRLYVYDGYQGNGIGKLLCQQIILISKELGYIKMRLDTVGKLKSANKLYEKIGFYDIPQYRENPDNTARFMELDLTK